MKYEDKPFEERPIEVSGHRVTYGDLRKGAHEMIHYPTATGAEKGLSAAILVLLDQLEEKS